jgi:hypothetical protein
MDTIYQVMEDPPADPKTFHPPADRDLCAIALKCLEKDPAARYESAADLADDLDRWAAGETTRARPLGPAAQAWRWLKRHTTAAVTLPALGIVIGIWPTLVSDPDVRPELLPPALDSPLGWFRLIRLHPIAYLVVSLITFGLSAAFGWLVVRMARPKTAATAIGFGVAVAAVASISSTLWTAPVLVEQGWTTVADGGDRFHPVGNADPDSHWVADSRKPGTEAYAEAEYLRQFLPPEKRALDYEGWETDLRRLRKQAARVNRLRAGYGALGEEVIYGGLGTILWGVLSTWVVVYLDRKYGRRWSNLVRYFELTGPTLFAVALPLVILFNPPPAEDVGFFAVTATYFGVVAVLAWVGITRGWRWWVRWGLYTLLTVGLFAVATVIAVVQGTG